MVNEDNIHMTKVIKLDGDRRCETLLNALEDTVYERGQGLSMPAVIGVIDLLKDLVKANSVEQ